MGMLLVTRSRNIPQQFERQPFLSLKAFFTLPKKNTRKWFYHFAARYALTYSTTKCDFFCLFRIYLPLPHIQHSEIDGQG